MHVSCSPQHAQWDQLLSLKLSKVRVIFILEVLQGCFGVQNQKMITLERESWDIFLDYKKMKIDSLKNLIPGRNYSFTVLENHHGWNVSRAVALGDINFDGILFV